MEQEKKSKRGKFILIGVGVLAIAGLGFYLFNRRQNQQSENLPEDFMLPSPPSEPVTSTSSGRTSSTSSSDFPLSKGSRGHLVKNIQRALIARFGESILPKYGADGHWGQEMESALKKKGLPTRITRDLFNRVLASGTASQLTGLSEDQLKTIKHTRVWNEEGKSITVPAHTIIGEFVDAQNEVTQFRTLDNKLLFIKTNAISYV